MNPPIISHGNLKAPSCGEGEDAFKNENNREFAGIETIKTHPLT